MYNEENYQVSEEEKWQIQPRLKGERRAGNMVGYPGDQLTCTKNSQKGDWKEKTPKVKEQLSELNQPCV